jgi:hypothetical protein
MNVEYLIQLLNNKLVVLNNAKILAFNSGDLSMINSIEEEILGVNNTISQLKLLQTIDIAAASANITSSDVVTSGIEAIQNVVIEPATQGPSASAYINGYDISAYATDPFHEQKIQDIVNSIPQLETEEAVDNYIQDRALGSFVSGNMVIEAAKEYKVDIPLLLAIMQNDSLFGTTGIAVRTLNPGNVGNNGFEERFYSTWREGVLAVAEWLYRHKITPIEDHPAIDEVKSEDSISDDQAVGVAKRKRKSVA